MRKKLLWGGGGAGDSCVVPLLAVAGAPSLSPVGPFLRAVVDPDPEDGEQWLHGEGTTTLVSRALPLREAAREHGAPRAMEPLSPSRRRQAVAVTGRGGAATRAAQAAALVVAHRSPQSLLVFLPKSPKPETCRPRPTRQEDRESRSCDRLIARGRSVRGRGSPAAASAWCSTCDLHTTAAGCCPDDRRRRSVLRRTRARARSRWLGFASWSPNCCRLEGGPEEAKQAAIGHCRVLPAGRNEKHRESVHLQRPLTLSVDGTKWRVGLLSVPPHTLMCKQLLEGDMHCRSRAASLF